MAPKITGVALRTVSVDMASAADATSVLGIISIGFVSCATVAGETVGFLICEVVETFFSTILFSPTGLPTLVGTSSGFLTITAIGSMAGFATDCMIALHDCVAAAVAA